MQRFLVITLILISIAGCNHDKPGRDLIPAETLVPVLIDLHMSYAIQSSMKFRDISRQMDTVDTQSFVFEKYDVTKVVFDSTIAWYSRHPELFTDIYDEVVMRLSRMSDSLNAYEQK